MNVRHFLLLFLLRFIHWKKKKNAILSHNFVQFTKFAKNLADNWRTTTVLDFWPSNTLWRTQSVENGKFHEEVVAVLCLKGWLSTVHWTFESGTRTLSLYILSSLFYHDAFPSCNCCSRSCCLISGKRNGFVFLCVVFSITFVRQQYIVWFYERILRMYVHNRDTKTNAFFPSSAYIATRLSSQHQLSTLLLNPQPPSMHVVQMLRKRNVWETETTCVNSKSVVEAERVLLRSNFLAKSVK